MISFRVNSQSHQLDVHPMKRLLDVLREDCQLTGTKEGCGEGECGACTILIDDVPVNSCLIPAAHADGTEVLTIEGLGTAHGPHPLQEAFVIHGGAQCGICTPGMIMAALAVKRGAKTAEIQEALAGNLCRCTGYEAIYTSVKKGARSSRSGRAGRSAGAGRSTNTTGAKENTKGTKGNTKDTKGNTKSTKADTKRTKEDTKGAAG